MRSQHLILRAASLLAPGGQRAGWLEEWQSELWYVPRRQATRFCLGAFRDALWLRRNSPRGVRFETPLRCLAFLAFLAAASAFIALHLPAPRTMTASAHLRLRDLPEGFAGMLLLCCGYLPAMLLAMGRSAARPHPVPWRGRLRLGIFLALKIALVQPILFCAFAALGAMPLAPPALWMFWTLWCRWLLIDQRRRCPVCLRLLTNPVRIGTPSQTFLEWYGAESMCSRGHGLLQTPEISDSYSAGPTWLRLGDSWIFPETAGMRQ